MTTMAQTAEGSSRSWLSGCWWRVVGSATIGCLVVWAVARAGSVDLTVGSGADLRTVGWPSVLVASALAAGAGWALLTVMQRQMPRGRAIWTGLAVAGYAISLDLGPAGADGIEAFVVLAAMHTVVLVALVGSAWRR